MALLNDISVSVDGAYSLSRYLSNAFVGSAVVRLREDNLSAEQNFKLDGGGVLVTDDVNEDTVTAWLTANSASNAYMVTWFDQSGNNYNFTQTTASNQPLLTLDGIDGKASARSSRLRSTEMRAGTYQMASVNGCFVAIVHAQLENRATDYSIFSDANSSTWLVGNAANLGGYRHLADNGQIVTGIAQTLSQEYQVTYEFPSGADPKLVTVRRDGAQTGSGSFTIDARSGTHKIFRAGSLQASESFLSELIFDNSQFSSADRTLVEDSQGIQFGIITPSGIQPTNYYNLLMTGTR